MRLKIKMTFKDKETDKLYKKGDIVNFKKERAEELLFKHPLLVEKAQKNDK